MSDEIHGRGDDGRGDELPAGSRVPSVAEVAAEAIDLGRMAGGWWFGEVERTVTGGLLAPARAASGVLGDLAGSRLRRLGVPSATTRLPVASAGRERPPSLRERGAELLRRSADVREVEDSHPAYRRILDELAPDEARILRHLFHAGPQPVVDVRSGIPPATRLVEADLSLVALDAGCRRPERLRPYLDNLRRLGLVTVSPESVSEPMQYQLLEAQPEVTEVLEGAGRMARTARRSVGLTGFGRDFCQECLPPGQTPADVTHPPA